MDILQFGNGDAAMVMEVIPDDLGVTVKGGEDVYSFYKEEDGKLYRHHGYRFSLLDGNSLSPFRWKRTPASWTGGDPANLEGARAAGI